jgi:hypothetical protein
MKKVIRLTESELTELIQRIIVETKMDSKESDFAEMEEGFFGASRKEKEESKTKMKSNMENLLSDKDMTEDDILNSIEDVLNQAKQYNYKGTVKLVKSSKGKPMLYLTPELTKMQKLATGTGSQTAGK